MSRLDQAIGGFQGYCFGSRRFYTWFAGCSGLSGFIRDSLVLFGDILGIPMPLGMPWLPCLFRKSRISRRETGFFAYEGTVQTTLSRFYTPVCERSRIFYHFRLFRVGGATKVIGSHSPCIQKSGFRWRSSTMSDSRRDFL